MASPSNSELLQVFYPAEGEYTLVISGGEPVTMSGVLDQVSLDQAIELLKIAHMKSLREKLTDINANLHKLHSAAETLLRKQ